MRDVPEAGASRIPSRRVLTLAALAIAALAGLIVLVAQQMTNERQRESAVTAQAESFEIIARTNNLATMLARAESALGRYIVSGDRRIGQEYSENWSRAANQIARLQVLTRNAPEQQQLLTRLQQAYRARGSELSDTARYAVFERNADALGRYYQVSESPALQQLTQRVEQLAAHERARLARRSAAAAKAIEDANDATRQLAGFGIVLVFGAILLGWLTLEALGGQAQADREAGAERVRSAELEDAVAEATAQLRAEARERAEAEARLRQAQKMEAVGQLTGGIAHDFNNMLAVVLGGLELAKARFADGGPDAQKHIENAMEGANRAAALTRRLLAFSRAETLLPEAVAPDALVRGMSDLLDRTLGDAVAVKTADEGLGWKMWADRHQLENALLNLAVNARDAMEGRGTLTLATGGRTLAAGEVGECAAGEYVMLSVSDTGCGMTEEVVERVFEPFFTTKPVGQGTGLGLSQIFGFVRQSDGEIDIRTAPGEGTTVSLYFPRYIGTATPSQPIDSSEEAKKIEPLDIFVVEDDPRVLSATLSALDELGHRAVGCNDPLAAPERLGEVGAVDLIISDVLMPGQTGPEMISALSPQSRNMAVLFVTGYAGEADTATFGGHPVLRKPFTIAGLSRAVEEAVAQQRGRSSGQLADTTMAAQ